MNRGLVFMLCGLMMLISACSKDDPEPLATLNFQINNGPVFKWYGPGSDSNACLMCGPKLIQWPTYFTLGSTSPDNYGRSFILTFTSSEVNVTTYTETIGPDPDIDPFLAPHVLYLDPLRGASTQEGDFATVTITRIQAGYYDGSFEARITALPYGPEAEKLELKGEFKNLQLY